MYIFQLVGQAHLGKRTALVEGPLFNAPNVFGPADRPQAVAPEECGIHYTLVIGREIYFPQVSVNKRISSNLKFLDRFILLKIDGNEIFVSETFRPNVLKPVGAIHHAFAQRQTCTKIDFNYTIRLVFIIYHIGNSNHLGCIGQSNGLASSITKVEVTNTINNKLLVVAVTRHGSHHEAKQQQGMQ